MVHFSISEDTVCITPPEGDYNRVHYWQAPDFLDSSLFVDFLKEIVDAISHRDQQKFLEILDPAPTFWDELQICNRGRKRWFDDKTCLLRVREECLNFDSTRDFISIFPHEESVSIPSADVLVNNEFDPSGELRKRISQYIAADIALYEEFGFESAEETEERQDVCVDDTYPSDDEEEIDEVQEANPEKPCYYPSQIEMATILKKRIDTIMWHYHSIANLSDAFDDVEFAVYTARYRMLSDQTEKRICHPDAGVLSREELKSRKEWNGKKRMFMYVRSAETDMHFEQLRNDVQEKPRTLFIIIADECHWGITKDKDQKPSAHNLFINEWCKENSPRNVIVVQISATPFNLLTQNSRLPEVSCLLLYDRVSTTGMNHYAAGDLLVLDREHEIEQHVKEISKEVELHVVHWSEVELKNFERGMRMKLKSTLVTKDTTFKYLHVSSQGQLGVVHDKRKATDFLVQGSQGIVTIKAISSKPEVYVLTREANGMLEAKVNPQQPATFEVKLEFGVGVAAFSSCDEKDHFIAVDDQARVSLQTAKIERKCGVSIMKPKQDVTRVSFEFYIDECGPAEVDATEKQYMSLNYYLSTINCQNRDAQKVREDEFFQRIVDKAKRQKRQFKADALLCAEYCYYILHIGAYNSDEKIRQVLVNSTEESPADQFSKMLCDFTDELKRNTTGKTTQYISHEAFELVRREICNEEKENFKEIIKKYQRQRKAGNEVHKEELEIAFVACLMHFSRKDLQSFTEVPNKKGILEDIRSSLQENNCQKMIRIWRHVVNEYETGFLVKSLIQSGEGKSGKMKIVRARSMETANKFYKTLKLARKLSSLETCFEIIRDYGGIQIEDQLMRSSSPFFKKLQPVDCQFKFDCSCRQLELRPGRKRCNNCQHVHRQVTQYEDLEDLACVLILVDKGRMGDTFPQSFDCLDLRLNYDNSREFKEGSPLFLSTVIQELGRMCRYAKQVQGSFAQHTPYVLVGRKLFKNLAESARSSPAMSAISCTRPDRYMSNSKTKKKSSSLRWLDYEAHKDSYDYGNKQEHCNRILLQAEPQIGKTGTYLCLIKKLKLDILEEQTIPGTQNTAFEEGSFYIYKHCDAVDDTMDGSGNNDEDWRFPYWKTIENSPSLLEKAVGQGKYSIGGLFYTHDIEDNPFILMEREEQRPIKSNLSYQKRDCADGVRSWHWYHFENCVECGRLLQGELPVLESLEVNIDGTPVTVTCSLPTNGVPYNYLRGHLRSIRSGEGSWTEFNCPGVTSLSYWIFHPSHRDDPRKCLLNYHHVMQEESQVVGYLQVAVVRSEMFQAYKSTWGKVIAIFQLPDELPNCERGPSEGGVGYARLFIQKIAFALKLEYVFVIDDNVALMSEAVFRSDEGTTTGQSVVRDENGVMKMERCSFLKPLTYLQKIASGKGNPPNERIQYEPHPLKDQPEGQQFPLYTYTGPAKLFGDSPFRSYGVLGLLRSVPKSIRPFAKTQVYAAVLLNVKSTVEKKVFYRPWPCWEDLRFNDDCDKADLWVVKCNRFLFHKVQYKDWIMDLARPTIFVWGKDSFLEKRPLASELPKVIEEEIILDHLRSFVKTKGHEKCFKGQIGYDRPEDCEDHLSPTKIIDSLDLQNYTCKELIFTDQVPVFIVSYCASVANRKTRDMMLLISAFCAAQENIIFITSAKDAIERWPGLTLATIASHNGICLTSEMSDRCGRFSILSAADPRRHHLRWIVIETSFSKEDGMMLEGFDATVERNVSENVTKADESIPVDHQQDFSGETASEEGCFSTNSKGTVDVGRSSQPLLGREPGIKESFSANRSPYEISGLKRAFQETLEPYRQECSSLKKSLQEITCLKSSLLPTHTFRQESPNVKQRTVEESPSKRRKINDYFDQKINQTRDEQSVKKTFEKGGTDRESSNGARVERKKLSVDEREGRNSNWNEHSKAISETEQSKVKKNARKDLKNESNQKSRNPIHTGHESMLRSEDDKHMAFASSLHDIPDVYVVKENGGETSRGKKVKKKKSGSESSEERYRKGSTNDESTSESEHSKVRKKKKKQFQCESSQKSTSPSHSSQGQEIMSKNKEKKQRESTSSAREETDEDVETISNASSQTSTYSIQGEDTEWPSVPDTYSADDLASNSDSNTSHLFRTSTSRNEEDEKMSSYMAGTNDVTAAIVHLWNQRKQKKKREDETDLSKQEVQARLAWFVDEDLEMKDQHGYNALLKACSLPSMSPHVMQHLIVVRKVDLNCRLPDDFKKHHSSAKGLIPGMSALSVAIRRQNISCISTFKRREAEINVREADQEGNTALHHCVLSASKGAFQKVFPLYKQLKWKKMFNRKLESPLDIAQNLAMDNAAKKKQAYILEELKRSSLPDVFRYMAVDCSKISLKLFLLFTFL